MLFSHHQRIDLNPVQSFSAARFRTTPQFPSRTIVPVGTTRTQRPLKNKLKRTRATGSLSLKQFFA